MILPYLPMLVIDVSGSVIMVVMSFMALHKAMDLRKHDSGNTVFLYLVWICTGFTIFSVSRSFGHILKQVFILTSQADLWAAISPYTGAINTVSFMLVGLITVFFEQNWKIHTKILVSRKELEETHLQLVNLNRNLEHKVIERTEMLTTSEHKCRRIFEQSLDTILVTDGEWKISEINPAGVAMIGYTRDEMVMGNMSMKSLFASDAEWIRIRDLISSNEYILNAEAEFVKSDGLTQFVLITGGIDYGAFGCAKRFHFLIKNINEKKEMEQQIAQADKLAALGELSAGVAHEINNPLGIILGYTQLMLQQSSDETAEQYHDDLKIIEKHVKNCKNVVSDLLAFSRKGTLKQGIIDINRVVEDVAKFLFNHSDFRDIKMSLDLSSDGNMQVVGNEEDLKQVVINLVINAGHAVNKNGEISISTEKNYHDQILIKVRDNGKGISKKNLSKIFDPFFTTKPVGMGTGLGLSVSYGIIKKHKGSISVKSLEGDGACFTITLPFYV